MIKWWGILPYWVNYTAEGLAEHEGGHVNRLTITINPQYKEDKGLFYHELQHIKQYYKSVFTSGLRRKHSTEYKLRLELNAFIYGQIKYGTMTIDNVVKELMEDYDFGGVSELYIREVLKARMGKL